VARALIVPSTLTDLDSIASAFNLLPYIVVICIGGKSSWTKPFFMLGSPICGRNLKYFICICMHQPLHSMRDIYALRVIILVDAP
jgi:hypothetical protein